MRSEWRRRGFAAALALVLTSAGAVACPACLGTGLPKLTLVQQLIDSDESVVAAPGRDGLHFTVVASIRGARKPGEEIALAVDQAPWNGARRDGLTLLGRHLFTRQWVVLGQIAPGREGWLREIAAMKRTKALDAADWAARAAYFVDFLSDAEPLVRATAYGELARAPYPAMTSVKAKLDAATLLRELARAPDADGRGLVILLLGIEGGDASRRWIDAALTRAARERDATNLAALVTAFLEGSGRDGLQRLARVYVDDPTRGADEIHNLVVGLGVEGGSGGSIPQQEIVPIFAKIVAARPEAAGPIAEIMSGWSRYDLAEGMARATTDSRVDEGSRLLIANYLLSAGKAGPQQVH